MLTLKQVEAFYWVARLGTLQRAADKLHITQSAMTKRLQDLEAKSVAPLLDRTLRKTTLTPKGREILAQCERLLDSVGRLQEVSRSDEHVVRVVHVGVTDLVALTWFPSFMRVMRDFYPEVTVQPEIDLSVPLRDKLIDGRLDLAILPEPEIPTFIARIPLGRAQFGWFCPPGSFEEDKVIALQDLSAFPVIEQTSKSIITVVTSRMFDAIGIDPERIYGGNNVIALSGLIEAGVGISCLPVDLFAQQVKERRMQVVRTDPPAPAVSYDAVFLKHPHSALGYAIADIARRCCNFGGGAAVKQGGQP